MHQTPALIVSTVVVVVQTAPSVVVKTGGGLDWPQLLIAGVAALGTLVIAGATLRTFSLQRRIGAEQERQGRWIRSIEDPALKVRRVRMERDYDPSRFGLSIELLNPGKVDLKIERIIAGFGSQWGLYHDSFDLDPAELVVKPYELKTHSMSKAWDVQDADDGLKWPAKLTLTILYVGSVSKHLHIEFEITASTVNNATLLPTFDGMTLSQSA